ncbi:MAG: hypothetical protein R3E39_10295 [Anaerolineae bacterium]
MTSQLSLQAVVPHLVRSVQRDSVWQIMDANHPHYGAFFSKDSGLEEAGHGGTARFVMSCGLVLLVMERHPELLPADSPTQSELLERMSLALDYMQRAQRPSGLLDLRSTNYDSSPDTGFVVEQLCALTSLARGSILLAEPLAKIEAFIRRAVPGILIGGFHTPNHRWVIVSALSQAQKLFNGLDAQAVIQSYVAEGFDADEEGAYIERSVGIYDAVSNRALTFFAENWDNAADVENALNAVGRNLDFDLHLLHPDGTAETGLSRRQDYGTRTVPLPLITPLLQFNASRPDVRLVKAAQWLWECSTTHEHDTAWQCYALLKYGDPPPSNAELPTGFVRHYPRNQIWRVRTPEISASVFGGVTRLMTLVYGAVELSSIKISQTYFGVGHFIAETMTAEANSVTLHSSGVQKFHKPGYELPLGRPVAPEQWEAAFQERGLYPIPPAASELKVESVEQGFDFHFRTLDGLDQVPVQIAFDFPAGGYWETDDSALQTEPGQVIFLKQGYGHLRFGDDVVRIGLGAEGHRYYAMRHAEPVPADMTRILITFITPVDHRFSLRLSRGLRGY